TVKRLDAIGVASALIDFGAMRQLARLLDHEGTVHQEQSLLGHGGVEPNLAAGVWIGEIEGTENPGQILAINQAINCAPAGEWFGLEIHGNTAESRIELSGEGEQRVAHLFKIE